MRDRGDGLGPAIRRARLRLNLTQLELAERLGTSAANVSRWETGKAMPLLSWLGPLCRALEVEPSYFVDPPADVPRETPGGPPSTPD
jgi:transcriptional regulator with XRE-family HTH domain